MLNNIQFKLGNTFIKKLSFVILGIVLAIVLIFVLHNYIFGKLAVSIESDSTSYRFDNSKKVHNSSETNDWVRPGKHLVYAFGTSGDFYSPKTFEISVKLGQTAKLDINLEPSRPDNDVSGDSFDPNGPESEILKNKLPTTVNNIGLIYFDYSEAQYHVELIEKATHENAIKWFTDQGVKIDDISIIWSVFTSPDPI